MNTQTGIDPETKAFLAETAELVLQAAIGMGIIQARSQAEKKEVRGTWFIIASEVARILLRQATAGADPNGWTPASAETKPQITDWQAEHAIDLVSKLDLSYLQEATKTSRNTPLIALAQLTFIAWTGTSLLEAGQKVQVDDRFYWLQSGLGGGRFGVKPATGP